MALKDLGLKQVYDSAECDLIGDLIVPLLSNSEDYLRGVGFFTSGWLHSASRGIVELIENEGKARIVTSPVLQKEDWEALKLGDQAGRDLTLLRVLREQVKNLKDSLEEDSLNALAWMIADELMEIIFAIPRDLGPGDYHDKVAVFSDKEGDRVAIHGSFNDSIKGSLNGEAFSVFKSWEPGQLGYVNRHEARLQKLWNGGNNQFLVFTIPDAIRAEFVKLRTLNRPYTLPKSEPKTPNVELCCKVPLRGYQQEAIHNWLEANCKGVLEMATGTGKTITALAAGVNRFDKLGKIAVLILVPYLHLLEQWKRECEGFGFRPLLCSSQHDNWTRELQSRIQDFRLGVSSNICVLVTHKTSATERFAKLVRKLPGEGSMIIADEMHGLGAQSLRTSLPRHVSMRLGLSATPRRWFDPSGTEVLFDYFGETCFEYSLGDAIGEFLTPYNYTPMLLNLNEEEIDRYEDLSRRIAKLSKSRIIEPIYPDEEIKKLMIKRAAIVACAEVKLPRLLDILSDLRAQLSIKNETVRDTLVYCAPGTWREVLEELSGMGFRCHKFVHEVPLKKREQVLRQFENGEIQVLIAVHCLDEGVDIPSTRRAFFLSSTSNPREFVQRRGRILRKAYGKRNANVYDFMIVPRIEDADLRRDVDLSLLRREMPRFVEFSSSALNEFEARAEVRPVLDAYEMLDLLDKKPWDVYHELTQTIEKK